MFTCKTEKPLLQRHSKPSRILPGLKYFVSRRNIIIKINIWIALKLSFTVKGLYGIDSKFASGAILVFSRELVF